MSESVSFSAQMDSSPLGLSPSSDTIAQVLESGLSMSFNDPLSYGLGVNNVELPPNWKPYTGMTFNDFNLFSAQLRAWCAKEGFSCAIRSSESLFRGSNIKSRVCWICQSNNGRKPHHVASCNACPWLLRIAYQRTTEQYKIGKFCNEHNHELCFNPEAQRRIDTKSELDSRRSSFVYPENEISDVLGAFKSEAQLYPRVSIPNNNLGMPPLITHNLPMPMPMMPDPIQKVNIMNKMMNAPYMMAPMSEVYRQESFEMPRQEFKAPQNNEIMSQLITMIRNSSENDLQSLANYLFLQNKEPSRNNFNDFNMK